MKTSMKVAYGVFGAALVLGGLVAVMATRSGAMSAEAPTDGASNLVTMLFGGGGAGVVITGIIQAIQYFLQMRSGTTDNAPHQAIFSAILAGMNVVNGKAAKTSGQQTLGNGTLKWDVEFVPTVVIDATSN